MHPLATTSPSLLRGRKASGCWHSGRASNGLAPHLATRPHAAAALMDEPVSGATFMNSLLDLLSSSLVLFFIICYLATVDFRKTICSGITRERLNLAAINQCLPVSPCRGVQSGGQPCLSTQGCRIKPGCPVAQAALSNVSFQRKHINKARLQG